MGRATLRPMTTPSVAIRHVPLQREEPCGTCGARFIAAEDSGSRVLLIRNGETTFTGLMCGGCHSKWSQGGRTMTFSGPILL